MSAVPLPSLAEKWRKSSLAHLLSFVFLALALHGWRLAAGRGSWIRYHDTFDSEWPRFVNQARALLGEGPSAWLPHLAGGMPANAFHFSQFHPFVVAHLWLEPWAVFDLMLALNWFVAGYGLYRLLSRSFGVDPVAALVMGIAYASFAQSNVLAELTYECAFPLIVSLLHRPGRIVLSALAVTALTALAYPVLHSPAFGLEHVILLAMLALEKSVDRGAVLRAGLYWVGYSIAFMPNLAALIEYLPYSHREYHGLDGVAEASLLWQALLAFSNALNFQFWQYGTAGALFGALAVARWRASLGIGLVGAGIALIVSTLLGSSLSGLFQGTLVQKLDLVHLNRMLPSLVWVLIGLAMRDCDFRRIDLLRYALGALLGLGFVALTTPYVRWMWWLPPLISLTLLLPLLARQGLFIPWRPWRLHMPIAVLAAVCMYCGAKQLEQENSTRYDSLYADSGPYRLLLNEAAQDPFRVTVYGFFSSPVQVAGLETTDGRSPVFDRSFKRLFALAVREPAWERPGVYWDYFYNLRIDDLVARPIVAGDIRLPFLAALNVRYIVSGRPIEGLQRVPVEPIWDPHAPRLFLYRVPESRPRGYFVPDARLVDTQAEAEAILAALPDDAWSRVAVLVRGREGPPAVPEAGGDCGSSRLVKYTHDELVFTVENLRDCVFLVANNYHHRWSAWADGRPLALYRANLALQAVVVPAGQRELRFTFVPPFFPQILALVLAGLAVIFAACVLVRSPGPPSRDLVERR